MGWLEYQVCHFDEWLKYCPNATMTVVIILNALFWGFIALSEMGVF